MQYGKLSRRERIEALAREAAAAGDEEKVYVCRLALKGDVLALRRCDRSLRRAERAIDDAIDEVVDAVERRCHAVRAARQ